MARKLLPCLLFLCATTAAFPQARTDTTFIIAAKQNTINRYQHALRTQSRLYNGSKYLEPDLTLEHYPYFTSDDWVMGSVFYDGEYFEDVPLMYDLLNDALVTEHFPSGHPIQLIQEKLQYFSMAGHYFEKIENESVSNSLPRTGFYDVLYQGETKVVAERQKFLREEIESMEVHVTYEAKNRYYIFRNGVFFPVKSKSSVLKLMEDKKQELKRFLKQEHISFSVDRELALRSLAEYYDTLR